VKDNILDNKDNILKNIQTTLEAIERAEGVWEQNENWENRTVKPDWGMKTKYASIPRSTGKLLKDLVIELNPKTILEIGSSVGYSTLWMAAGALEISGFGKVYSTEINPSRSALAKEHFKMASTESIITLFESDAKNILQDWDKISPDPIDLVFLDAFKKDYPEYLDLIYPILKDQGIIIIDNIITHANLLEDFFKKIGANNQISTQRIDRDNGLMLIKKLSTQPR
jgi:predicted O-methyltransferase YrrM